MFIGLWYRATQSWRFTTGECSSTSQSGWDLFGWLPPAAPLLNLFSSSQIMSSVSSFTYSTCITIKFYLCGILHFFSNWLLHLSVTLYSYRHLSYNGLWKYEVNNYDEIHLWLLVTFEASVYLRRHFLMTNILNLRWYMSY